MNTPTLASTLDAIFGGAGESGPAKNVSPQVIIDTTIRLLEKPYLWKGTPTHHNVFRTLVRMYQKFPHLVPEGWDAICDPYIHTPIELVPMVPPSRPTRAL